MPTLLVSEQGSGSGTFHGTAPDTVNGPGALWSVAGGAFSRSGGRIVCTSRDGFAMAPTSINTGYALNTPGANIKLAATVNMAGVTGSANVGVGITFLLVGSTQYWVAVIMNYFDGVNANRGLRFFLRDPSTGGGLSIINVPGSQAVFTPDVNANHAVELFLEYDPAGVKATFTDGTHTIELTVTQYTTSTLHGPFSGTVNGWLDNVTMTVDNASLLITSPVEHQVIPMVAPDATPIPLTYNLAGGGSAEARLDPSDPEFWQVAPPSATTTHLYRRRIGRADLIVRDRTDPSVTVTVPHVGGGPVIALGGHSNVSGRGDGARAVTENPNYPGFVGSLLRKDGTWGPMADYTHANAGSGGFPVQNDSNVTGSIWPLVMSPLLTLGDELAEPRAVPIGMIAGAKGSSHLGSPDPQLSWTPSATNLYDTATLLGALLTRVLQVGGLNLFVFGDFATQAYAGRSQSAAFDSLCELGETVRGATGAQTLLLGETQSTWYSNAARDAIAAAYAAASGESWCAGYVDLLSLPAPAGDGLHPATLAEQQAVATKVATVLRPILLDLIQPPTSGGGGGGGVALIGPGLIF